MTETEAIEVLQGAKLVQVAKAGMHDIKRMRDQALKAGIPALMDCPAPSGKG
jgi:hypothetical protein